MTPGFQSALLVEDEPNLVIALKAALKKLGMVAYHASSLSDAKRLYQMHKPEFVLLDRGLPDGEGLDLCKYLREGGFPVRILILTASGKTEERVEGLDCGADDYLPKPFSWEELEARIRALSRRGVPLLPQTQPAVWDRDKARLRILGPKGWAGLTPLEFNLATRLIENAETIVSRDDLLRNVWGFTLLPKTRTVDHFLGRLRKIFEEDPEFPKHFITIRGAGYLFTRDSEIQTQSRSGHQTAEIDHRSRRQNCSARSRRGRQGVRL